MRHGFECIVGKGLRSARRSTFGAIVVAFALGVGARNTAMAQDPCIVAEAKACVGGTNDGLPCSTAVDCPGGLCTGTGTVTLPPEGCDYLSPTQFHEILGGLPPGTTIEIASIHRDFICKQPGIPQEFCNAPGGVLGGDVEQFNSTLELDLTGGGGLAGFTRHILLPNVFCEVHTGPRTPGDPIQTFPNEMVQLQGSLVGDPDFDSLQIIAGQNFGLPSPGQTTLTQQPGGDWAVDSFFDITYQIDFVGAPGSVLAGMSGSTQGTLRMVASGVGGCTTNADCDDGDPCTIDTCDLATGSCVHTPVNCDDGDPCTQDSCDPVTGTCVHVPIPGCPPPPDPHATVDPTSVTFGSSDVPAIPANFFFPGSDPLTGLVQLQGGGGAGGGATTDTIVQRLGLVECPNGPGSACDPIPIEIVELKLTGSSPIKVPPTGEPWSVELGLSPAPPPQGQLDATLDHANGGSYTALLPVMPRFTFTKVDNPAEVRTLDYGELGIPAIELNLAGPWVISLDPSLQAAIVAPGDGEFVPGVDELTPGDTGSQVVVATSGDSKGGGVSHTITPPPIPQPVPCCLPDGTCVDMLASDCAAAGGAEVAACPPDGRCIPSGDDCWNTECGKTLVDFCDNPIPANFFGPGSLPFDGVIRLGGDGDPATPDTIVRRDAPMGLQGTGDTATIPIEIVQLSLRSCEPITVDFDSGPTAWNVDVALSATPVPLGSMEVTKTHDNGGTFKSDLNVQPVFTFTRVGDPTDIRVLDTGGDAGFPPANLGGIGLGHWVHDDGGIVTPICGPFVNFVPGVKQAPGPVSGSRASGPALNLCCTQTGHAGPGHLHVTGQICVPCPEGACCNTANGSCTLAQGAADCNGEYKGDGTDCADNDGDGVADWFETNDCCAAGRNECNTGTDPNNPDTDGDGFSDGFEIGIGCDPCVPDTDTNLNGIPDGCETFVKFSQPPKSGLRVCSNIAGQTCVVNSDCWVCIGGINPGSPCTSDADCSGGGTCDTTPTCDPDPTTIGEDYPSDIDWVDMDPNQVAADDFTSDGRPITAVRWWGSNRADAAVPTKGCDAPGDPGCFNIIPCGDPGFNCACARQSPDGVDMNGTGVCIDEILTCGALPSCNGFGDAMCDAIASGTKCIFDACCGFVCVPNCPGLPPLRSSTQEPDQPAPRRSRPGRERADASSDAQGAVSVYASQPPEPTMDPELIQMLWPENQATPQAPVSVDDRQPEIRFAQVTWEQMEAFDRTHAAPGPQVGPLPEGPAPTAVEREGATGTSREDELRAPKPGAAPSVLAPPLKTSFQGTIDDGTFIPPDTMGAVGPNHVVEILNSGFTVFDRAGGVIAPQITLQAFWSSLGTLAGQPASRPFDPKILYDQYVDRWVVISDGNPNARDGTMNSWLLVGISQTPVPTGPWNLYAILSSINDVAAGVDHRNDWCDYPGVGLDPNNVIVSKNMFTVAVNPGFVHADVWVVNKATMMAGVAALIQGVDYALFHDPCGTGGFTFQPCHTFGQSAASAVNHLVDQGWLDVATQTRRFIRVKDITGVGAAAVLNCRGGNDWVEVNPYNFCQLDAPQPLCSMDIETNDPRLLNAVCWKDTIWTTHSVGAGAPAHTNFCGATVPPAPPPPTKTEIAWYEISPAAAGAFPGGVPNQQGRVVDSSLYYYFPSIAVNKDLCVALGFSGSDANTFASGYYTVHDPAVDAPGATQPVSLLKAGVDAYWKQFSGSRNRWGDFSATVLDPRDFHTFWTVQEYAEDQTDSLAPPQVCSLDAGRWGTWWGSFQCENPIDGWFISFHEHLLKGDPQAPPLALYYCDTKVVDILHTELPDCQEHQVFEYFANLDQCCLVHAEFDSRTGNLPAMKNAFYEEECLPYHIDIQAVVGHKFFQDPVTQECIEVLTGKGAAGHFWGWHTTTNENGINPALETFVKMGPAGEWLYGPWNNVLPKCSQPNMAFELITDRPLATEACCFPAAACQDLPPIVCCNQGGTPQGPGTSCATTGCPAVCGDGICTSPPEDPCNCPGDCGAPPTNELGLCADGVDNDCDTCIDGADSDCGGTETSCTDGVDNDCDTFVDCADSDCAGIPPCFICGDGICTSPPEDPCNCPVDCGAPPPNEAGLCTDGIDNDCDGPIDCNDSDCFGTAVCCGDGFCDPIENSCTCPVDCGPPPPIEINCADGLDDDCDGCIDFADSDCGGIETNCTDGVDNDCDMLVDCADPDCFGIPPCIVCGDGICSSPPEDPCNCPADCGAPPPTEVPGSTCADGIDNDCDGPIDCNDPDCTSDPTCCPPTIAPNPPNPLDVNQRHAAQAKNRYLSFVPTNPGQQTALQVTLVSSTRFPGAVGSRWWVGPPQEVCENSGQSSDPPPPPPGCGPAAGVPATMLAAKLQCNQHCMDWGALGRVVHVSDPGIVPDAVYAIRAIDCACDPNDPANFSGPLAVPTSQWGDLVSDCTTCPCGPPNGTVDVPFDCVAILDKFSNDFCAPIKSRTDIDPADPNRVIDISDAVRCLDAFGGLPYPFPAPVGCP